MRDRGPGIVVVSPSSSHLRATLRGETILNRTSRLLLAHCKRENEQTRFRKLVVIIH
jgi:hypothetical protein